MSTLKVVGWILDNLLALGVGVYLGWRFGAQVGRVVNAVEGAVKWVYAKLKGGAKPKA